VLLDRIQLRLLGGGRVAPIDRDLIDLDEIEIEKILSPELIDTLQRSIDDREMS